MKKIKQKDINPITDLESYYKSIKVDNKLSIEPMRFFQEKIRNFYPIGPYYWYALDLSDFSIAGVGGGDMKTILGVNHQEYSNIYGGSVKSFVYKEDLSYHVAYNQFCWKLLSDLPPENRKNIICTHTVRVQNMVTQEISWVLVQYLDWIFGTDNKMYYILVAITDISHIGNNERVKLTIFDTSKDKRTVYYTHTPTEETPQVNENELVKFTQRQKQIIKLMAQGYLSKQIADILSISVHTVNNHRSIIMKRAGVHNCASLLVFASHNGLI